MRLLLTTCLLFAAIPDVLAASAGYPSVISQLNYQRCADACRENVDMMGAMTRRCLLTCEVQRTVESKLLFTPRR